MINQSILKLLTNIIFKIYYVIREKVDTLELIHWYKMSSLSLYGAQCK